ncbi:uncharacterized protein LOC118187238 [Stegodyphus dumicola]|uniref:uncharacterized protein LOC118187238 n=1 Tax=Stegodyphus dumicola TaxID=202533 RepID=UPI0015B2794F|nr:uncharacterized protein LOC118187238 [Stegodyphus dumicola]XP_035213308.1 uncharacterized protein LOC118187238 [Stegodyphus dumicola]
MSHFLRQYHIVSTLKSNTDKDVYPFYKIISPLMTLQPAVRKLHTQNVGKNLHLNTVEEDDKSKKPLAVILAWMLAKESHIAKYRSIYLKRGFDVLTVDINPKDMLFPVSGCQVTAANILDYLVSHEKYNKVIMHAFSVGGYLMGEMFVKMRDNAEKYKGLSSRIAGVILDSAVDVEGIPTGFPRAISKNPITIKALEWYVSCHLALVYNVATKHYLRSSKNFHNTPLRCPALFFVSEADKVGSPLANQLVIENWQVRGIDTKMKCWKDSKHVSHFYKHEDEYLAEIDQFLGKIGLGFKESSKM